MSTLSASLLAQLSASAGHSVSIVAAADSSRLGAFDNVFLYSGTSAGGPGRIFTDLPGNTYQVLAPSLVELVVDGTLDFSVASRLEIAASSIRSVTPGSATPQSSVTLAAPYILLTGGFPNGNGTATAGASTLVVNAQTIDIEGAAFNGFSSVRLTSSGDIRLSTPKVADGLMASPNLAPLKLPSSRIPPPFPASWIVPAISRSTRSGSIRCPPSTSSFERREA